MAEEVIKIKKEDSQLTALRKNLDGAKNDFLKLQQSGTASSKALSDAGRQITQYGSALNKARKETTDLANATKKMSGKEILDMAKNLTIAGVGLGILAKQIVSFGVESLKLGASLTVLKDNFQGTAKDIEDFKKATAQSEVTANLIALSNRATALGFTLSQQKSLFSLAEDAADAYGGSVVENTDRIIDALAKNGKGLESLGIVSKEYKRRMAEVEKSYSDLGQEMTDETRITEGFKIAMELAGKSMGDWQDKTEDVADILSRLGNTMETVQSQFGEGFINAMDQSADGVDNLRFAFDLLESTASYVGYQVGNAVQAMADQLAYYKQLFDDTFGFTKPEGSWEDERPMHPNRDDYIKTNTRPKPSSNSSSKGSSKEKEIRFISDKFAGLILFDIAKAVNNLTPDALINFPKPSFATVEGGLRDNFNVSPEKQDMAAQRELLLQTFQDATSSIQNILNIFGVEADKTISVLIKGFNDIASIIQGIISFVQSVNAGISIVKTIIGAGGSPAPQINPQNSIAGGNTYLKLDLNTMQVVKDGFPQYQDYINSIRVS